MNRLKELRLSKDWRQADLAAVLNTKPQTVSRYEKGDRDIDSATICKLCEIFGCTADYLLCRSPLPTGDLTEEEQTLLLAFRRADDHTRKIVRTALEPFAQDSSQEAI